MKLCTNCEHFRNGYSCDRPTGLINPVNGSVVERNRYAHEERGMPIFFDIITNACGRRGRFFKRKAVVEELVKEVQ